MTTRTICILRVSVYVSLFSAVIFSTGCAATSPPPHSGFLGDYPIFEQDPKDESLLWWEQEGFSWKKYDKVMLDPISIYYHSKAQGREILPSELNKLTEVFRSAVISELSDNYSIVDEPAADVLRIRCAVTDVIPINATLNIVTSLVAFVPVDMGGAAIEVEFLDSVNGDRLAAGLDQKLGTPVDGVTGFTRRGHAKSAFRTWDQELRIALDTNP